jgi:hypothetical protein
MEELSAMAIEREKEERSIRVVGSHFEIDKGSDGLRESTTGARLAYLK